MFLIVDNAAAAAFVDGVAAAAAASPDRKDFRLPFVADKVTRRVFAL